MSEPTRVLVVDDQDLVRHGLRMILELGGIEVVGEAADGQAAVAAVKELAPEVVLMDVRMPGTDGVEATRQIVAADATAFGPRDPGYLLSPEANWEYETDDAANIAWARDVLASVDADASGGSYLNFPGMFEEGATLVRTSFGPTYDRLAELKRAYDPDNVFQRNQNILPAATR